MTEYERVTKNEDNFFKEKYKEFGIKSRRDWFIWKTNKEYGETYNLINYSDKNYLKKQKGTGSSEVIPNEEKSHKERVAFIPERYDIEDLFKFSYEELFSYKPNVKFNKIYSLVFNHKFYNIDKDNIYRRYIEIYNDDLLNGNIDKINDICQRLSQYIIDNDINMTKYVGGSIICNIALMISNYIKTGILETDIDFISKMTEKDMNEEYNSYCLFLLCQLFTSRYRYVDQYVYGILTKEWWRICHIRHRYSDKDMKSKGVCPRYNINCHGEINYVLY